MISAHSNLCHYFLREEPIIAEFRFWIAPRTVSYQQRDVSIFCSSDAQLTTLATPPHEKLAAPCQPGGVSHSVIKRTTPAHNLRHTQPVLVQMRFFSVKDFNSLASQNSSKACLNLERRSLPVKPGLRFQLHDLRLEFYRQERRPCCRLPSLNGPFCLLSARRVQ